MTGIGDLPDERAYAAWLSRRIIETTPSLERFFDLLERSEIDNDTWRAAAITATRGWTELGEPELLVVPARFAATHRRAHATFALLAEARIGFRAVCLILRRRRGRGNGPLSS